ncbi:hypothetical protein [Paenibacillus harenae]|uniref:hypothetical protein n=1 Tax=Paenibacillus harenae TaxID=306543 RepID=UPI0012EB0BCD|nr:hypothetical protein [Paenibacillus harenae]
MNVTDRQVKEKCSEINVLIGRDTLEIGYFSAFQANSVGSIPITRSNYTNGKSLSHQGLFFVFSFRAANAFLVWSCLPKPKRFFLYDSSAALLATIAGK